MSEATMKEKTKRQKDEDERARTARACLRGGMAPYMAARKKMFTRVALMQQAIEAMEKREKLGAAASAKAEATAPKAAPKPAEADKPGADAAKPACMCAEAGFVLEYYAPTPEHTAMYRIMNGNAVSWMHFKEEKLEPLARMLAKAAGMYIAAEHPTAEGDKTAKELLFEAEGLREENAELGRMLAEEKEAAAHAEAHVLELEAEMICLKAKLYDVECGGKYAKQG